VTAFLGNSGYDLHQLRADLDRPRADLDRFTFLLGANNGESTLEPEP
jgi:hypothetical protein